MSDRLRNAAAAAQVLGEGVLQMDQFRLEDLQRAEPHPARLRVRSPKGQAGGGGVLHLLLKYDLSPPRLSSSSTAQPPPSQLDSQHGDEVGPQGDGGRYPRQGLQQVPEEGAAGDTGSDDSDSERENGAANGVHARQRGMGRGERGYSAGGSAASRSPGSASGSIRRPAVRSFHLPGVYTTAAC